MKSTTLLSGIAMMLLLIGPNDAGAQTGSSDARAQETAARSVSSPEGASWTSWLNRDAPSGTGDFENLDAFVAADQACSNPRAIECQTVDGRDWSETGQAYTCDRTRGGICFNAQQGGAGRCLDYRVRFLCPASSPEGASWTPWLNRDAPSGTGDFEDLDAFVAANQACSSPGAIECQTVDGRDWSETGQVYTCDRARGGICFNAQQDGAGRCLDYRVRFLCPAPVVIPEDSFRRQSERLDALLQAARAGEETGPFERKQLLRWYRSWQDRVGREGRFEEYPEALFAWAAGEVDSNATGLSARELPVAAATCDLCLPRSRWVYRGPDGLETQNQGVVRAIWVAPDDPDRILAGGASGLWATTDGGETWRNLTATSRHLRLVGVLDIAVNPNNQKEIYIGTGLSLSFSNLDRSYGFGVFRTVNGGRTWSAAPLADLSAKHFPASHRVLYHPLNPMVLYAALGPEVYKSVDGGKTWALLFWASAGTQGLPVRDLAIRPIAGGDEVLVATSSATKEYIADPLLCAANDPWTYISATIDKKYCEVRQTARVWRLTSPTLQTVLVGPPVDLSLMIGGYDATTTLTAVEVTPAGVIVATHAGLMGEIGTGRVVLYKEAGSAWTKITSVLESGVNYGFTLELKASRLDPNLLYLSGLLLMKSTDGGATFSTMGQSYWGFLTNPRWAGSHPDVRSLTLGGQGPQGEVVYFGTDGGVSRTSDALQSTENLNGRGLHLAEVHGVGVSERRPGLLVFGTQHNGFFTNRDYVWTLDPFGDFYDAAIVETPQGDITALSTMNASSIRKAMDANLPLGHEACPESTCMDATLATVGNWIYLGRASVWRRPVGGGTWDKVAALPGCIVSGMAASADGGVLYVACGNPLWSVADPATFKGKAYRIAAPSGPVPTVSDITSGLSAVAWQSITDVATNADGSVVYISLGGFGNGVFRYLVGGSWSAYAGGLPAVPVNALAYDRDGDALFAGTDVGVFAKTLHSKGWVNFGASAPFTVVSDLEIDGTTRTLAASTFGHGVWAATLPRAEDLEAYCKPFDRVPPPDPKDAPW